ncbi:MAG: 23S rRNA (adenine(2503)-C(2))-methyltransferase RlmN [Candidatus Gracilibacteria bacterium]|jgi:23S rRNA (adenine2503-C2)-methyltransferase|nr:23S rRNA (adenine(2503)-C(2))-methyltransferase RlmN [Candidatus Gracilibacteria bacterium]
MFQEFIQELGDKKYRIEQFYHAIFRELVNDIDQITVLPKETREKLKNKPLFKLSEARFLESKDGKTYKTLLRTPDGHHIETVLMAHQGRNTVCVSSQIGCMCGCIFCATGKMGLIRNLETQEIIEQLLYWSRFLKSKHKEDKWNPKNPPPESRIRNVVFMGMGEPLLNFDNVIESIKIMNEDKKLGIGSRRITISTVGIIPAIKRLKKLDMQINLAVSLHFPDDELRSHHMPQNKIYPLKDLMETLWDFSNETLRRIFFEYTVIKGVNDTEEMTNKLGALLEKHLAHVNFIPLNENPHIDQSLKKSQEQNIRKMQKILDEKYGIKSTIREEFGADIQGACGQLAGNED